jgi:hypothetical protein
MQKIEQKLKLIFLVAQIQIQIGVEMTKLER